MSSFFLEPPRPSPLVLIHIYIRWLWEDRIGLRSADVTISVHLDTPPSLPLHFPQYECAFDYIKDGEQGEISLQNYMKQKHFFSKIILEFFR